MRDFMLGIFLDTEASGLDAKKHKILEVAFKIVDLSTGEVQDNYESLGQLVLLRTFRLLRLVRYF
ncbi:hypothetical protein COB11_07425, partial [Candidatus Aerophobetes bacterium]